MSIHVGFYDEIHPLLGARRCEQESCAHQKHAIWHGRDGTAGRHCGGTVGTGIVQQQSVTSACAKFESHRLRGMPSIYMKLSKQIGRQFLWYLEKLCIYEIILNIKIFTRAQH